MPPEALILQFFLTVFLMIFTAVSVDPLLVNPVEVLMKSTFASKQISEAFTIPFFDNSLISRITFSGVLPMADFTS